MDTTDNTKNNQNNPLNVLYYENRELELLKNAINIEAKKRGERIAQNPVMKDIISVLEKFIRDNHLVCYGGISINALFWSATKHDIVDTLAWSRYLYSSNSIVSRNFYVKSFGASVRCLRD